MEGVAAKTKPAAGNSTWISHMGGKPELLSVASKVYTGWNPEWSQYTNLVTPVQDKVVLSSGLMERPHACSPSCILYTLPTSYSSLEESLKHYCKMISHI